MLVSLILFAIALKGTPGLHQRSLVYCLSARTRTRDCCRCRSLGPRAAWRDRRPELWVPALKVRIQKLSSVWTNSIPSFSGAYFTAKLGACFCRHCQSNLMGRGIHKRRGAVAPLLIACHELESECIVRSDVPEHSTWAVLALYIAVEVRVGITDRKRRFLVEQVINTQYQARVLDTRVVDLRVDC